MPRALLPPRGIFVLTMMINNREIPPKVVHTWIQLPGLPLLKSSIAMIAFMALPLAGLAGRSGMGVLLYLPPAWRPALGAVCPLDVVPHSGIRCAGCCEANM